MAMTRRGRRVLGYAVVGTGAGALGGLMVLGALLGAPAPAAAREVPADAAATAGAAYRAGFRGEGLVVAIAVAAAESGYRDEAVGTNPPTAGCPAGSRDRGRWQINDCYHPEVTDACAADVDCAAVAAYRISSGGAVWTPWTTFREGRHLPHEPTARAAAAAAPLAGVAAVAGNALPLPRDRLSLAVLRSPHWDGRAAWDGPAPPGTPVFAIADGAVVAVYRGGRCGIGLTIASAGYRTLYCHGSRLVVEGGTVAAGQVIMASGSTGERVTGPHLHLEIEVEERKVCPQRVLIAWFHGLAYDPAQAPERC